MSKSMGCTMQHLRLFFFSQLNLKCIIKYSWICYKWSKVKATAGEGGESVFKATSLDNVNGARK